MTHTSNILDRLFTDHNRYSDILANAVDSMVADCDGTPNLIARLRRIPTQFICIGPMALCDAFLTDLNIQAPRPLLAALGLVAFGLSTHDDIVDERPARQREVAELLYAGNIATLAGIQEFYSNGYHDIARAVMILLKQNHIAQNAIVHTLWQQSPESEDAYLQAISHAGYWASTGLTAGTIYATQRGVAIPHGEAIAHEVAANIGYMYQILDDIREAEEDEEAGYYSLVVSTAIQQGLSLSDPEQRQLAGKRSRELAGEFYENIRSLCEKHYPTVFNLATKLWQEICRA